MKRQRYQQMNPLSDMLPLLPVFTGLQLFQIYLLGTICLDFSHYCPAPFFSVPFMMHNTNNRMQSLTIGNINGWMRMHERKVSARAETDSVCQKAYCQNPHTSAVDQSSGPPEAVSRPSRKSVFLGVHSCHLTFWGTAGASGSRQKGKAEELEARPGEAWPAWPPQRRKE